MLYAFECLYMCGVYVCRVYICSVYVCGVYVVCMCAYVVCVLCICLWYSMCGMYAVCMMCICSVYGVVYCMYGVVCLWVWDMHLSIFMCIGVWGGIYVFECLYVYGVYVYSV